MDAYTTSRLADAAGVSINVVRDYVMRGLLHPAQRTPSGYGLYDELGLARLRLVRALFEAGIGLDELKQLCHALDHEPGDAAECLGRMRSWIAVRRNALASLDRQLAGMVTAASNRAGEAHRHA